MVTDLSLELISVFLLSNFSLSLSFKCEEFDFHMNFILFYLYRDKKTYYFRYFVPYVHIGKFVAMTFKDADNKLPVMCIGITSGIGRLIFGYIADLPKVNRIFLQQVSIRQEF